VVNSATGVTALDEDLKATFVIGRWQQSFILAIGRSSRQRSCTTFLLRLRTRRIKRRNEVRVYSRSASDPAKTKAPAQCAGAPAPSRDATAGWEARTYSPWMRSRDTNC